MCLLVCLLTFLPSFLLYLLYSFLILSSSLIYFYTRLLSDVSIYFFQNRPICFQAGGVGGDQTWL